MASTGRRLQARRAFSQKDEPKKHIDQWIDVIAEACFQHHVPADGQMYRNQFSPTIPELSMSVSSVLRAHQTARTSFQRPTNRITGVTKSSEHKMR